MMFGGTFAPQGWAWCDGSLQQISENDALFQLIGTTYGGDGQSTFALPDLRGRVPVHMGTNPSIGTIYTIGEAAGVENVTLTTQQMPSHNHAVAVAMTAANSSSPTNNILANEAIGLGTATAFAYAPLGGTQTPLAPQAIAPAGGNQPHENRQQFLTLNFIIALFGEFPSQ
jgi:microcystin-dependent protein